jgi:hypothetical protein
MILPSPLQCPKLKTSSGLARHAPIAVPMVASMAIVLIPITVFAPIKITAPLASRTFVDTYKNVYVSLSLRS